MSPKILLVQSIALLYWESRLEGRPLDSRPLINQLLQTLKLPETVTDTDLGRENLTQLRYLLEWLVDERESVELTVLKQRLRLSIIDEDELYQIAVEGLAEAEDETAIFKRCQSYISSLNRYFQEKRFEEDVKKFMQETLYNKGKVDVQKSALNFMNTLAQYSINVDTSKSIEDNKLIVKMIDFENMDNLVKRAQEAITSVSSEGIMRTGYQGVNRMLGSKVGVDGLIRGDCYLFGARRGQNKSGMTMDITMDICRFNIPYMFNPNKTPLVLHITCENSADLNMRYFMDRTHYMLHGTKPNYQVTEPEHLAHCLQEYTGRHGYVFKQLWIPGSSANYMDIQQILMDFENMGYEIHVLCIDYLALLDKTGCEQGAVGNEIRDLYRKMRNFCNPRKITLITPHQVSGEATNLVRAGETNLVEKIVGLDYYDGCRRLTQEVDVEIVLDIVRIKEGKRTRAYQTMAIGKNRAVRVMPDEHKSCCYEFTEDWGLIPDVEGDATFISDINSIRKTGSLDGEEELW